MASPQLFLIDDNPDTNFLHNELVKTITDDVEIRQYTDPITALSELIDILNSPERPFITVFLDYRMPLLDGFDFLEELENEFDELDNFKLYVLTNDKSMRLTEKLPYYYLVNELIEKPLSKEEIQRKIAVS